jgi:Flp pilus assembly protein TadG
MRLRDRRGGYAALYALALFMMLGFGSLAIDVSMLRLSAAQAQDIADAASQAALLKLRTGGSTGEATAVATLVTTKNEILGSPAVLKKIEFGKWQGKQFSTATIRPNAVRVAVGRDVDTALASVLGVHNVEVQRRAVSASREIQVILVMDITNSWSQANFANARAGAVLFYDRFVATAGPMDRLGMVVFTGQYGVEHTPLYTVEEAEAAGVRANWNALRTASKAGTQQVNGNCSVYSGAMLNNFSNPLNGCYPNMWREYIDESGTDHTTGLEMAQTMFLEYDDTDIYRALLILTDGQPNGTGAHTQRASAGYVENRWQFFRTPVRRTTAQVQSDSNTIADMLWQTMEVNLWAVSFIQDAAFLNTAVHGDGYYTLTSTSASLVPIFEDIAESLPTAVVE